ncbi:MAG: GNAT family N-acetyltransferase [Oscillospiraceae bacterium]|nr:GNAT family N-acetyltransferase [Oscillospiraceae bacterium]
MPPLQDFYVREAGRRDLSDLLRLYTHLHDNPVPSIDAGLENLWAEILNDQNHHILLGHVGETLASSCVAVIVRNLTRGQRPYALIENVVTHPDYRRHGYGLRVLSAAKEIAVRENCYKIMLMTGSKEPGTLDFYKKAGYSSDEKTAFIQRL